MKPRLGIIGGSGLHRSGILRSTESRHMETPYGEPSAPLEIGLFGKSQVAFLARHGPEHTIPPHRINHRANVWSLKEVGIEHVVSTSSVGSLKQDIKPGDFVVPDDYLCPWYIPSYHDDKVVHVTPELDPTLRSALLTAAKQEGVRVHSEGVYVQTRGPRLETKAEIRMMTQFGDVVGMTVGAEATLARELDVDYASICTVDNYAHGLVDEPLAYDDIVKVQKANSDVLRRVVKTFLGAFL